MEAYDNMFSQLFKIAIYFGVFIGIMISLILIVTFIKILTEISKLKSEKKAYELIQDEEEEAIKLKKIEIEKDKRLINNQRRQVVNTR